MGWKNTIVGNRRTDAVRDRGRPSSGQLVGLCITVLMLAGLAVLVSWIYVEAKYRSEELARLRAENDALHVANHEFVTRLWRIQSRLTEYEQRTRKLAVLAGLEIDDNRLALGGEDPEPVPPTDRLASVTTRSKQLGVALDEVESAISSTPSIAPAAGVLSSRFGYRLDPMTGERSFHRGIDIDAEPNSEVRAAADGWVRLAGRDGALGTAIRLQHDGGFLTRYGHMSELLVESGERVMQGQILGYVGRTGRATGYHLHYEVIRDGRLLDPLPYLRPSAARR